MAGGLDADGKPAAPIGAAKTAAKKKAAPKPTTKKPAGVVKTKVKQGPTSRSLQLGCTKCRGSPIHLLAVQQPILWWKAIYSPVNSRGMESCLVRHRPCGDTGNNAVALLA